MVWIPSENQDAGEGRDLHYTLYTDDQKKLADAIRKSDRRMSATEWFDMRPKVEHARRQRRKAIDRERDAVPITSRTEERDHDRI